MKLPIPQYIVFYNGSQEHADEEILRLSDAFDTEDKITGYEWTARMLNINYGKNHELMKKCKSLRDYATLVDKIKNYINQKKSVIEAIEQAVDECIKENIMAEFLKVHRAEVMDVCITEYNEEKVMEAIREEGHMKGREEGRKEGREEGIRNTLQAVLDFGVDIQTAVTKTAEKYEEDEKKIWDIWEKMDKA